MRTVHTPSGQGGTAVPIVAVAAGVAARVAAGVEAGVEAGATVAGMEIAEGADI